MNVTEMNFVWANSSNASFEEYLPYDQRPETYIVPVVFLLIFIIGVLGNGTLVIIFLKHRTMRNVPNTYILSLALADLLVIVTSVPFTSIIYTVDRWPWNEFVCKVSETAKDISVGVSVFTLTALSANRFFAIVDPLKKLHATGSSKKASRVTAAIIGIIWLLAIILAIPSAIGSHLKYIKDDTIEIIICYPFPEEWGKGYAKTNVMVKFIVLYVIPLIIIAVFYMSMANHLVASTRNVPGEVQGTQRQMRARKKVAVTVLVFVLVFAVCLLPTHIFMLYFYFDPNFLSKFDEFWQCLRIVGFCLFYMNSCVNPVALYWVSGAFRKHFNRYLLCMKPARKRCDTCQGQHIASTMSMVSSNRRAQSVCSRKNRATIGRRQNVLVGQETSITLLGNGMDHACSKM